MEDEQDICSKNKIISSIQYQQDELSKLARLLQCEKDREKYKKVIEMSKIIQVKLEYLQEKKPRMNSFGKKLNTQNSNWSLVHHPELSSDSSRSSSRSSDTRSNSYCGNSSSPNDDTILFNDQSSRYHTYNGHSYRVIDRVTSLQFQPDAKFNYRRPSADTILVDLCLQQNTKSNTPQINQQQQQQSDDDEEDELQVNMTDIHIAVRRDASLFKIEKLPTTPKTESLTVRPSPLHSIVKNKSCSSIDLRIKENIVLPEEEISLEAIAVPEQMNNDKVCLDELPRIINVQKKAHQRIKGLLLKRTYQINQYIITKTNSTTLPFSTGILYRTSNTNDGKSKLILKLIIVSLDNESSEDQTRFGFTFWWQNHHTLVQKDNGQDDSKFALAPDSLVKESLVTWIASRNQEIKGVKLLPSLGKSDEILRDGRKVYIVYDESLFPL